MKEFRQTYNSLKDILSIFINQFIKIL